MLFDPWTLAFSSAIVVMVASAIYIIGTLAYKDNDAGRIWSVAYMAGVLTTLSYLNYSLNPETWWTGAVGNASLVVGAGFFWSGSRVRNGHRPLFLVVAASGVLVALAALARGPEGGPWAGASLYFLGVAAFAAAAAIEMQRGRHHNELGSMTLTVVFSIQSAYYLTRLFALTVFGAESTFFTEAVGSSVTAVVSMILIIVLSATMAMMRAERTRAGTALFDDYGSAGTTEHGVLRAESFHHVVGDWLERCKVHGEQLALIHLGLDNLDEINAAFGRAHGDEVLKRFTTVVRHHGPPHSDIGQAGTGRLVVAVPMADSGEAVAAVATLQTRLLDEPIPELKGLRPTLSVGVALSGDWGYHFRPLSTAARIACDQASAAGGNRVIVASSAEVDPHESAGASSLPEVSR